MLNALQLLKQAAKAFPPPPDLSTSEWADTFRQLSSETSSEPGQWYTDRVPYAKAIMDSFDDNEITVAMTSTQIAKTEILNNALGKRIHLDPGPTMIVLPTQKPNAESYSKKRLYPMIRDTPVLAEKIDIQSRKSSNTILEKFFPGGSIRMVGANSPTGLCSDPIRYLFCDEVDRYPSTSGTEGDPLTLAFQRTDNFPFRRIGLFSTPGNKGASRIEDYYEKSDKKRYFVPCPHCGFKQVLKWTQVKWDKNDPANPWYECENPKCNERITDAHKEGMLAGGEWIAEAPFTGISGFHLNALYSPWLTLAKIVKKFMESKDNPETLKTFVNTTLGETYDSQGGEGLSWQNLYARCEPYAPLSVPMGGLLLTAGVDVQRSPARLAVSIYAWGIGEESWKIYHIEIYGEPTEEKVWNELDSLLSSKFTHESGAELGISAVAVDAGYSQNEVYQFVRKRSHRNFYAIRGQSQPGKPIIGRPTWQDVNFKGKVIKKGVKLWPVGSDTGKSVIYSRLRILQPGAGYVHFPIGTDDEFFKQLTAEKLVVKYNKGFPKQEWVVTRRSGRNEALDCFVYAYAAAVALGVQTMDWNRLKKLIIPEKSAIIETDSVEKEDLQPITRRRQSRSREIQNFATDY